MESLPFEVLLQVFEYLPVSNFKTLYHLFPQIVVDEALVYKLRNNKSNPMLNLISTNLHELAAYKANNRNESSLSLYFASYDPSHRFIWSLPDFSHADHYFRVKDAYVSHGKLVLRQPHDKNNTLQKVLASLWDIRKSFPPTRAGSFSGASEYSRIKSQESTIHQTGCILDSCLIPSSASGAANSSNSVVVLEDKRSDKSPKRPNLPLNYQRGAPTHTWSASTYPDPTCGYFLVERLAISIPTFLELFHNTM
ncbi:unnamed protein product [Mucor hiemalis]